MLEIDGKDISELSDSDLRVLIGLLCEAELRTYGLPTAGVTWGGHQNAKDGGIDVRVDLLSPLHADSFIPRFKTGFQVKKPDMPRSEILKEMRPKGKLRQVIRDLIDSKGAYIIVSSQGSTADSALKDRKEAMLEALSDYPNYTDIKVDFYDRERIASWVRSHPALVLWVREKLGKPIQGWKTYENWANCPFGIEEEYMLDEHVRLYREPNSYSEGLAICDGINEIRNILHRPASSVRLVGLSGVGKTRLLQALFDERLGENPLNKSIVFYTDISDGPNPDPINFAERLVALKSRFILGVDNCPPDLHRRLRLICSKPNSLVSLITVEYDVKDDQPEETEVFRLEPASTELIEKVILKRFSHITEIDARSIANFSGGNARISIALGNTVKRGDNLSQLKDSDLFIRLFQQRNEPSKSLLRAAEACSLVYSFNVQLSENEELELLSDLVGMNVQEMYRNVSELMRRDLVQKRSVWRAVLPHAIANKLAQRALENIPIEKICSVFENGGSERLLKSFSRRLSYLHESEEALEISKRWLIEDGLLGDVSNLNELGVTLLRNIAPLNPELTLSAIERVIKSNRVNTFFTRGNDFYNEYTSLLRSLAYDKHLFIRSTNLLSKFALSEKPNENVNSIRNLLKSLFYIYLSGTHASADQRLSIIKKLVESNIEDEVDLGISLLNAALETTHFSSSYSFEFGARPRDYGYKPTNRIEIHTWYKLFIDYSLRVVISESPFDFKVKELIASKFRGLWVNAGMYDELEKVSKIISSKGSWREGWLAVRTTMRFDGKEMEPEIYERLNDLKLLLGPNSLIERAKFYSLSGRSIYDLVDAVSDIDNDGYTTVEQKIQLLGREVGSKDEILSELLPEILGNDGPGLFSLGQGIADGSNDHEETWIDFYDKLSYIDDSKRNYQVLRGFLNRLAEIDLALTEKILDQSVTDPILASIFPFLQISVKINSLGVTRLRKSLEYGEAPIWQYQNIAYGRVHETISDEDLADLLGLISLKENGLEVAIEILNMRLHGISKGSKVSKCISDVGQKLLLDYQFSKENNRKGHFDYELSRIIEACFNGIYGEANFRKLCEKLAEAYKKFKIYPSDYQSVLASLSKMQPEVFLNEFLGKEQKVDGWLIEALSREGKALSNINEEIIKKWCEVNPQTRYPVIASAIRPFQQVDKDNILEWTPLALWIMDNYYDPVVILNTFRTSFYPRTWWGSLAEKLQSCLYLITALKKHSNLVIAEWATEEEEKFKETIRLERENELKVERQKNERFE
ncbi:hypothetical protein SAMN05877753_1059 [Bacillus oleivorans]|uniref:Uncharacterized protein n=1 Tax=Bacillus oleivorans TaxID=1448271 RepID=A0A285CVV4_9BACI|nr:hypothetical protein [Bacillus oleivorans]SNX71166.1 hypothetical protein SAMN05877753_1059 [Bacillus oleivorans]